MSRRILENHSENEASPLLQDATVCLYSYSCTKNVATVICFFLWRRTHIPIYFAALMNEIKVTLLCNET